MRYLATLLGVRDQDALQWFVLVALLLLDPAAVLLFLVAAAAAQQRQGDAADAAGQAQARPEGA